MPFAQTSELSIHYEWAGSGDTVLVLLHGNLASWRSWQPVLDRLPAGYCAHAPGLRGFGETRRRRDGYSIPSLAEDLHALAVALGLPAFHLVGHSLGGVAALQFALNHQKQVRSLTLVAPAPAEGLSVLHGTGGGARWLRRLSALPRDVSLTGLDLLYRLGAAVPVGAPRTVAPSLARPLVRKALADAIASLARDDTFEALVRDVERVPPRVVRGYARALDDRSVEGEPWRVAVSVLILWGRKDFLIPYAGLRRTADGLPQGQLVTWPDVGHVLLVHSSLRRRRGGRGRKPRASPSVSQTAGRRTASDRQHPRVCYALWTLSGILRA
jgi:pimeloyl-ACP methyl ester carboxylesterase